MPYFTRLTDIITCSLTEILDGSENPEVTLREVIREIGQGLSGARRSARTAHNNRARIQRDIEEHTEQMHRWVNRARQALQANREDEARDALSRKVEIEDLLEGLKPEQEAAVRTCEHMLRIQKALEARHSEAVRRLGSIIGSVAEIQVESDTGMHTFLQSQQERQDEVEAELQALKKQLES